MVQTVVVTTSSDDAAKAMMGGFETGAILGLGTGAAMGFMFARLVYDQEQDKQEKTQKTMRFGLQCAGLLLFLWGAKKVGQMV
mmetsp:Transcript_117422/g.204061  ORF Transcript_117422/g.204061 Transcript_117422/m.204061 type:complete len:83 (-) Transcript_117422:96-344(-)